MAKEADWLDALWYHSPEVMLRTLLDDVAAIGGEPKRALRQAKRRAALLVGLAEVSGVWPVMEATRALTRFADAALDKCLTFALGRHGADLVGPSGGLVALAMGKMGAGELNYSSDIDLILLFDEARYAPSDYAMVRAKLLKAARLALAQMSDITADGYVFRTDLRLRPDPSSTPIVLSMETAERYYEAMGRTWERAAWIKARPAAGDLEAGAAFIQRLAPFVWRRHLDYAVVEDAHDMRLRIRDHKGFGAAWDVPGHHLKLGQGGIREIEFFTQTHQIISGGRDPSLRSPQTLEALDRLVAAGWVEPDAARILSVTYRTLRSMEHRLQMVQDAQTHSVPKDAEGIRRLACFMGTDDADGFVEDLRSRLQAVEAITDPRFRPRDPAPASDVFLNRRDVLDRWQTYPALRSDRARQIFTRIRPGLLRRLASAARPDEALAAFDGFLAGLPAGVQILSLFDAHPILIELVGEICAVAPDLARYLAQNAAVFDAVIAGDFLAPLPQDYDANLCLSDDFEQCLEAVRRWHREAHFRIGVHLLRGLVPPDEAARQYARLADAVLRTCWVAAEGETARRYGRIAGLRLAGLGMGSLGVGSLTARSDLDLVVLHDGAAADALSDGRRGLGPGQWAAKFTQVLITALNAPMGDGRLYEVDMRLRPSGRQGPLATSLSAFRSYQAEAAWVWEHMALTRARAVAGDADLRSMTEAARVEVLGAGRFAPATILEDLVDMRRRLADAKVGGQGIAVKTGPGRLQDIELLAQANTLLAGSSARDVQAQLVVGTWLTEAEQQTLFQSHQHLSRVQQVVRLLTGDEVPASLGTGGEGFVARSLGLPDFEAVVAASDAAAEAAQVVIEGALARGLG
ncbi:glutamate-ammonia-ligase adenylyltransferase [Jannaschia pagri]|uniref:Glutamate-ammonia-ligase adenylyltransferase n=2 Tax=Roseobacteraceae TaxID=2854170 RepID=A0ABQ4NNU3_9RHOB|nr:glutamate-ammonia-ligase adenylyltransferase [Jannaschia sp. AI_61]GIT96069.1 glutamate-ammonia-ligase adenylyltransferase [Jannaschia sp. AI_62]